MKKLRLFRVMSSLGFTLCILVTDTSAASLFQNGDTYIGGGSNFSSSIILSEDFEFSSNATLENVLISAQHQDTAFPTAINYYLYDDAGGQPALTAFDSGEAQNIDRTANGNTDGWLYTFDFEIPVDLIGGTTYWLGLNMVGHTGGAVWSSASGSTIYGSQAYSSAFGANQGDAYFELTGTVVPIPAAVWLFVSGLLGLVGIARRKKA